jgi:hypothetical protein
MPADRLVGVGNELAPLAALLGAAHRNRRNRIVVGQPVTVEPKAELTAQLARDFLVGVSDGVAGVDRHVGRGAALQQRVAFGRRQRARIVQRDQRCPRCDAARCRA